MDVTGVLAVARAHALVLMTSECVVTRDGDPADRVFDKVTGEYTVPPPVTVYVGPCKVQDPRAQILDADAGGEARGVNQRALHLPVDAPGSGDVARDDKARITACRTDPSLVGRVFIVRGPHSGSAKTSRRLPVQEVL